jgi:hypothetical protein
VGPAERIDPVRATLMSICDQRVKSIEVVLKVLGNHLANEILALRVDSRVQVTLLSGPDSGIYDAFNRCAVTATGRFILFLGCGDLLASPDVAGAVQNLVAKSEAHDILYGRVILAGSGSRGPIEFDNRCFFGSRARLPWRNPCHSQGLIYRRTWLVGHPFRTDVGPLADLVHTYRHRVFESAAWLDQPISIFFTGGASTAMSMRALRARLRGLSANCEAFAGSLFWKPIAWVVFVTHFIIDRVRPTATPR